MMSEEGVNLHFPFSPSSATPNPSHTASPNPLPLVKGRFTGLYQDLVDYQTLILVRDPPRERLAASRSHSTDNNLLTRVAGESKFDHHPAQYSPHSTTPVAVDARPLSTLELNTGIYHHHYHNWQYIAKDLFIVTPEVNIQSATHSVSKGMVKKRSSIQGILIPSFLQGPLSATSSPPESPSALTPIMRALSSTTSSPYASSSSSVVLNPPLPATDKHTRKRSVTFSFSSSRRSPPPAFLLDDDPFANLTAAPSVSLKGVVSSTTPQPPLDAQATSQLPRSPLYEMPTGIVTMPSSPKTSVGTIQTLPLSLPPSPLPRSVSGGRIAARPAHQRPAFQSRPSLPSLSTLARMNVVLTKKVRKGRVGAGLPFEPWDDLPSDDDSTPPAATPPRQDGPSSSSSLNVATPPPAAFYADPTANSDSTFSSQPSALQGLITPQPLLPSQIMALGSIAADVGMIVPVRRTPRPESTSSSKASHSGTYFSPILQDTRVPGESVALDAERLVSSGSGSSTFSGVNGTLEDTVNPIEDEEVADFLERHHQSSRNTSEYGHVSPSATIPAPATVDVLPILQGTVYERVDAEQIQSGAFDGQEVVSLAEEGPVSYNNASHQETKGNEDDPEDVAFDERHSHMYPDHPPHDDSSFMHSGSMLFSSPPSSFSLSRSLSSASHSSCASSDSVGHFDHAEDGDDELAGSESVLQRRSYGYRHLMDPSLSSLELDPDPDPEYPSRLDVDDREMPGTSRSSSGRPSLTRTRSSSNDSDVPYSPLADNYPFPHHGLRCEQYSGNFAPPELVSDTDGLEGSSTLSASNPIHESAIPAEGWRTTLGDYQSGMIGEGVVGFGFGFDKVSLPVEGQEENTVTDGVENESLASGTSVNVTHFSNANLGVGNPETTADDALPSFLYSHPHERAASSFIQSATPPVSPNDSVEGMLKRPSVSSRPVSAVKTSSVVEPTDATQSQSTGGGRAYMPAATFPRGNGTSGQLHTNFHRANYSRRYDGQGRDNSDDEDEGDERRRRRALERGHGGETVAKELNLGESTEDESDQYISAASSTRSSSHKTRLDRPRLERSPSRSPVNYTSPLLSGSSMKPHANFPLSSSSSRYVSEDSEDNEDDDVPLAKAIPGALTAQKTIRRQVREEREQRKREKAIGMDSDSRRVRQTTLRPSGANGTGDLGSSSSRDAATMAAASVATLTRNQSQARQRTLTLPGKPILNPHDLAQKLQNVQIPDQSPPPYSDYQNQYAQSQRNLTQPTSASPYSSTQQSPVYLKHSKSFSRPSGEHQHAAEKAYPTPSPTNFTSTSPAQRSRSIREPTYPQRHAPFTSPTGESHPPLPTLRSQRSFHRPSGRNPSGIDEPRGLVIPTDEEQRVGRTSATTATSPRASHDAQSHRSLSLSRRSNDRGERAIPSEPVPALPTNIGRTSNDEHRRLVKPNPTSTRTSAEAERGVPRTSTQHPPLPSAVNRSAAVVQQRVFVGNLQQFHMVEIGPSTTAGDVVSLMESQGALAGWAGSGGWMVFEIAQDFGMERPIRSYELLTDVQSSWLKDKTVNYFMLKLTPLVVPLARSAIPSSSPTHSGYIEWQVKRNKWSKRWIQLKEHSLWMSKRDNLKDQVLLCSLSNFDAYHVTRPHRAPKQFTFAVKSTDKLTFFENTDDYMHTFSCSEKDGKIWMEKILIARSYVLHQERHVLFGGKPNNGGDGAQLARSGTRKNSSIAHRPVQPLVNLPPFQLQQPLPHANVFEPGSLLSKQL